MHEAYISYDNLLKRGNTEVDVQNALLDKVSCERDTNISLVCT